MANCYYCKKKMGLLESSFRDEDNNLMCSDCQENYRKGFLKERTRNNTERGSGKKKRISKENLKNIIKINGQWEYKIVEIEPQRGAMQATGVKIGKRNTSFLNELGKEGWKLVSVLGLQGISAGLGMHAQGATTSIVFVFRRKICNFVKKKKKTKK